MKSFETSSRVSAIFFVETNISSSMYIKYISSKIPVSPRISSDDSGSINMLRSLSSLRTAVKQSSVIVVADRHVIPSPLHSSRRRRPHHLVFASEKCLGDISQDSLRDFVPIFSCERSAAGNETKYPMSGQSL